MSTTETEKPVIKQGSLELVYAEVVVSLATAVGLLVLTVIQLVYRTARRARFLWRSENQIRFDAAHFLSKPEGNKSRKIIMMGLKEHENRDLKPPPLVLPSVFANDRDVQADCLAMVAETREILRKQYGESACLMSMRCCLSCVENALPSNQTEEFLRIYESVLFGQHRIGVTSDDVTNDDIRFLYAFFHNTVLKEIQ